MTAPFSGLPRRSALAALFCLAALLWLSGCVPSMQTLKYGTSSADPVDQVSPEDEYYLGRAVAARVLDARAPLGDAGAAAYVNSLGQALALFAPGAQPFDGFTFILLDSADATSFAGPGGFVFVTRGMLGRIRSETELAGLLAHEIAHAQRRDPVRAMSAATLDQAVNWGREHAETGAPVPDGMANVFADAVSEVYAAITGPGHDRGGMAAFIGSIAGPGDEAKAEQEAANMASGMLARAGYYPGAADPLAARLKDAGLKGSHPEGVDLAVDGRVSGAESAAETPARARRFAAALGGYARKAP